MSLPVDAVVQCDLRDVVISIRGVSRGKYHAKVPSPGVTIFIGFAAQARFVCMYLLIGKGQSAQKDHIGAKIK